MNPAMSGIRRAGHSGMTKIYLPLVRRTPSERQGHSFRFDLFHLFFHLQRRNGISAVIRIDEMDVLVAIIE